MKIGGFQKNSLIDYPNLISAVVFTQGCNFKCPFCHNSELVLNNNNEEYSEDDILEFLKTRIKKLDAVSITGGEPTLHPDLPDFISKIKELGFKVKIDTNGTNPEMLKQLIKNNLLDFIAMDVKTELNIDKYSFVTGVNLTKEAFNNILESISIIKNSNIEHEFRTTAIQGIHHKYEFNSILDTIKGGDNFVIQTFNPKKTLDPKWSIMKSLVQEDLSNLNESMVNKIVFR
jgi:pyruvate formate lyase activating enzyme